MVKTPDKPAAIEVIPSVHGSISALASADAPFIYFDERALMAHLSSLRSDYSRPLARLNILWSSECRRRAEARSGPFSSSRASMQSR